MIDHVSIAVSDLAASADFYDAVLAPLGLAKLVDRTPATIGFGKKYPEFWLNHREALTPQAETTGIHICLRAPTEVSVREFFDAAIARGRVYNIFRRVHFRCRRQQDRSGVLPEKAGHGRHDTGLITSPLWGGRNLPFANFGWGDCACCPPPEIRCANYRPPHEGEAMG